MYAHIICLHLHVPSSRPLAHKALIRWCQLLLSCVCVRAWLHDVRPSCSLSFSSVLLHVVFGLPTLRLFLLVSMWELWHSDYCDPFLARVWSNSISSVSPLYSISVSVLFLAIHRWRWCMASVPCKSCEGTWIGTRLFSCCLLPSFSTSGCRTVPLAGPVRWTVLFWSSWSIWKSSRFYSIFEMFVSICFVSKFGHIIWLTVIKFGIINTSLYGMTHAPSHVSTLRPASWAGPMCNPSVGPFN